MNNRVFLTIPRCPIHICYALLVLTSENCVYWRIKGAHIHVSSFSFMFNRTLDLAQENPTSYGNSSLRIQSLHEWAHNYSVYFTHKKAISPFIVFLIIPVVNHHDSSQIVKIPVRYHTCCLRYFIPIRLDYINYPNS